jgi:hypothetical protein
MDNQSMIALIKKTIWYFPIDQARVDTKFHYIRECVDARGSTPGIREHSRAVHKHHDEGALGRSKFQELRDLVGIISLK